MAGEFRNSCRRKSESRLMGFFSKCSEAIKSASAAVERDIAAAGTAIVDTAQKISFTAKKAIIAFVSATVAVAKKVAIAMEKGGKAIGHAIVKTAVAVYSAAKKAFNVAKAIATTLVCSAVHAAKEVILFAENEAVNAIVTAIAGAMTTPTMEASLRAMTKVALPPKQLENDGEKTGCAACCKPAREGPPPCKCGANNGVQRPDCKKPVGKAHYVNGINTDLSAHCATLQALARATCMEMTGTFNATGGTPRDLVECLDNIQRSGTVPDRALRTEILTSLSKNEDLTLYAHSQGGLVTQSALTDTKTTLAAQYRDVNFPDRPPTDSEKVAMNDFVEEKMSKIKVISFGTAVAGWPTGPSYENYTNLSDPVPRAILAAQSNNLDQMDDTQIAPVHLFISPHLNPIDSHSMDNVYIPQMAKQNPTNCACFPNMGVTH